MHLWRIQQASSAYCSGVEIPVEMFFDWLTLRPYLAKVVQAQNEEERNSYDYADKFELDDKTVDV